MANINKKRDSKKYQEKNLSGEVVNSTPVPEKKIEVQEEAREKAEVRKYERILSEELKREIDVMNTNPELKHEVEIEKQKIGYLAEDEKLKNLMSLVREKGLFFAINVAQKMNDPFLLDLLHDTLANEGYFKDFLPGSKSNNNDKSDN